MRQAGGDFGSVLLGRRGASRRARRVRVTALLVLTSWLANAVGAGFAVLLITVGIPAPSVFAPDLLLVNAVVVPAFIAAAFMTAHVIGITVIWHRLAWMERDRVPSDRDASRALNLPRWLITVELSCWLSGAVLMGVLYGSHDLRLVPKVVGISVLGGFVVCGVVYQLAEFCMRPVAAIVLRTHVPSERTHGLLTRSLGAWALGSGLPLLGITMIMVFAMIVGDVTITQLAMSALVLAAVAAVTGITMTLLNQSRVAAPLRNVIDGMAKVERGRYEAEVTVYDASILGVLQAGFNSMAGGLREREVVRDLYRRQVGEQVARASIESAPALGGVERTVAVIFIDLIGSTTLAATRPPIEVVSLVNRFCAVVVEEVGRHGGLVNKFEGDAVLAIFGAPTELDDPAGCALAAARVMTRRLVVEVPEIGAGCGVSYGVVVAGYVGAADRFEYTVIGDPVNEAARLSSAAKADPSVPWASAPAVIAAGVDEAGRWRPGPATVLRGRTAPTQVYLSGT
ncbi:adenylate/guanylate cyclase domain-containing protein [Tsukamurella sp. 8F]|uniref:adenylate/guanylate cyclase domain-containing protein n=1 Tax=unclassified Tsukamurella TaxID=2633480 RepID=UPI0023BA2609|nr:MULTISPECIES: adenylate/guanylate cyclase domain-containing protein [unclassified Tsukamurella]MDF0529542.1 adenylate/guanylate cyclase domain-containing protein [Tsukamurella sp. 8J]MDF0585770.1 adenylate/guanylate cyclase domain-containing protein [Tsukamurella sp. 8F]